MTHLFLVAIGPVQDFIAAARRTADLQAGSQLLISVARTVAETLRKEHGAELIFPALEKSGDEIKDPPNKILVELPEGKDPCEVAQKLKAEAQTVLDDAWNKAWKEIKPEQKKELDEQRAKAQIARFLEFYAAWVPLEGNYAEARKAVERKLAGRKALREFEAIGDDIDKKDAYLPKSPLDPAWPTVVITKGFNIDEKSSLTQTPVFLKSSELLDAISLIKRVNGHRRTYEQKEKGLWGTPSTAEMAIRLLKKTWLEEESEARHYLRSVAEDKEIQLDFGDLFFETRVQEEVKRLETAKLRPLDVQKIRTQARKALKEAEFSSPPPYYAILLADGDRMGKIISAKENKEAHQAFSRALAGFAGAVGGIVQEHHGHLIYSGGDDVLALLPIHMAITCAQKLHKEFDTRLASVRKEITEPAVGTLSVGIAIVHYREPLQISLERARRAEKAAKDAGRDALAVTLHTRGGAPVQYAARWGEGGELAEEWDFWTDAFNGPLSRGLPYELRELARMAYHEEKDAQGKAFTTDLLTPETLQKEAQRIVKRKRGDATKEEVEKVYAPRIPLFAATEKVAAAKKLEELAGMMAIARFLARPEGEGR
jgi:CRISPR-associated protein Cmr2